MSFNIKEMDQTNWVCYRFEDNSYYYGEVAYLDENDIIHPKDSTQMAANPKARLIKHGFGIYIFNIGEQSESSRYQGHWDRDKKHGHGVLRLSDKTIYDGNFKQGLYHQSGKMIWNNGCSYYGAWERGRMEGGGVFKHSDGFVLKGNFKANYFFDENCLRNPFLSEKDYNLFNKQKKESLKQKEKNQKVKHSYLSKIKSSNKQQIVQHINKSTLNNRIPLIMSSEQSKFNLSGLVGYLEETGRKCNILDLRKAHSLPAEQKNRYKNNLKAMIQKTLIDGEIFIINLDQSETHYSQIFCPDLKEFYDAEGMAHQIWSRSELSRNEVKQKIIREKPISQQYRVLVWSKIKLSEMLQQKKLREKIQAKFQSIIPLIKIDIIFLTKPAEQQGEEKSQDGK